MPYSFNFGGGEGGGPDFGNLKDFFGPGMVDQMIRQAVQLCWAAMPPEKRTPEDVEREIRRLVDRALRDMREDRDAFGG